MNKEDSISVVVDPIYMWNADQIWSRQEKLHVCQKTELPKYVQERKLPRIFRSKHIIKYLVSQSEQQTTERSRQGVRVGQQSQVREDHGRFLHSIFTDHGSHRKQTEVFKIVLSTNVSPKVI